MRRRGKIVAGGLAALVVALLVGVILFGGAIIKGAVNRGGPALLGVPVTLERVWFRPLVGQIRLYHLRVGNPEGFKTPSLFELGRVDVDLQVRSLLRDTIVIRRIEVVAPRITYEKSLVGSSNIGALMKHLEGDAPDAEQGEPAAEEGGKKVVIDHLVVTDPELRVTITAAGGHALPIKLGDVEMKDLGRGEGGGVTLARAIRMVFRVLFSNIENAVLGVGELVGSGVKAVGHGAASAIKGVGNLLGGEAPAGSQE